ncbi:tetratricopeptide repeat-containing sensor histidine kinase [Gelidibacter salicanalis]|uniref:histidine kinase n=1 Tax=Gelidibacter salicanalis TaxID=291193 RepID=A0A934KP53_9FLAO|nr:tetratricopeptide repeat-containing sensor histidine kinase [Gelidibacter salicanalis]MBJ7881284.1 tetratricopeptide repeat-containing sensor histidine kinase [Gelidibacter salicanalis]
MKRLIALAAFFAVFYGHSQTREIDSLAIQLAYQKQNSSKVDTSIHLIKALYKAEEYQKALLYISETEQLSLSTNYPKGVAEANYFKALIYAKKNDYFNAIDHFNKSKKIYQQLKDTLGIAKVSNSIGLVEIKRGNYSTGLVNSLSAIRIFEERNLYEDLSLAYNNLAEAYYNTNQVDKALEFNLKALRVSERLQDSTGIKMSTKNIAELYSKRKEHRKAIDYYEDVLAMINLQTDQSLKGEVLPRIGEEYLNIKAYDKASEYLAEGLKYNRAINDSEGILRALNSIGSLNLKQNKTRLAERQIYEAHELAKSAKNQEELLKNYKLLMTLDSSKGRFQNAFRWQREYFNLKQYLELENQPQIPINTDSIEESLSTEAENEALYMPSGDKGSNNTKQVKNLQLLSYALIVGFLGVLTFLLLIYLKRKNTIKYTRELEEKNAQIQLQNDAILEQTHHLEEINKVKDRLFSIVSHDLKDSISSIKGFLDLLNEDSISREEFNELIPELSENANNASLLLFNLLNWSKSQMQSLQPKPELFNIQDIFHSKLNLVDQKVEQKRIVVIDESQEDFIYADKSMVEIIIQNLLTNAVKFSRVGDIITVSNRDVGGKSLICVEDTGVGISKENLSKLFQNNNFTTVGTQNEKGTGLGLTICKELVELNNGRIWVESTPNVGTKFYVELPKVKVEN